MEVLVTPGSGPRFRATTGQMARAALAALWAMALPSAVAGPPDADAASLEYRVKAAMLYNFTRFIEWPAAALGEASAPLVIAVEGNDPFTKSLEGIVRDKSAWGRPIVVRRFRELMPGERVQVLFVSEPDPKKMAGVLARVDGRPVLTVSDEGGFVAAGGTIGMFVEDGRVRFRVNRVAAARAGLTISSKLLRLAVSGQGEPE